MIGLSRPNTHPQNAAPEDFPPARKEWMRKRISVTGLIFEASLIDFHIKLYESSQKRNDFYYQLKF